MGKIETSDEYSAWMGAIKPPLDGDYASELVDQAAKAGECAAAHLENGATEDAVGMARSAFAILRLAGFRRIDPAECPEALSAPRLGTLDFESARLSRLADEDNSKTRPVDALALARAHLEAHGSSGNVIVIIEETEGGVVTFSSRATLAAAVFLCESAKFSLMHDDD